MISPPTKKFLVYLAMIIALVAVDIVFYPSILDDLFGPSNIALLSATSLGWSAIAYVLIEDRFNGPDIRKMSRPYQLSLILAIASASLFITLALATVISAIYFFSIALSMSIISLLLVMYQIAKYGSTSSGSLTTWAVNPSMRTYPRERKLLFAALALIGSMVSWRVLVEVFYYSVPLALILLWLQIILLRRIFRSQNRWIYLTTYAGGIPALMVLRVAMSFAFNI